MSYTDVQNFIQCLVEMLLLPIPFIVLVSLTGKLLMPKHDHRN